MKILYVITKSNWGGAQRHVYDVATAMKNSGHEVWVALGGEGILKKKLEDAGVYVFSIPSLERDVSFGKDWKSFREIFSLIRIKNPDILHLHSTKAAGLGALAGRILRVKNIYVTVHGWSFNESRPIFQKLGLVIASWVTTILTHKSIVLSEKEYDQGLKFPFVSNKLIIIPLGIEAPVFLSIAGARQLLGKMINQDLSKKTVVATIAELHPNKGLTYLIDAFEVIKNSHPNTVCLIISDGQDREKLESLVKEKGLENIIYFLGYIDQASEYMKGFNMFVLPSIKEGLPYVLIEAGYASLPVISTTVGGIPEIVEDMRSGILIQPKSSKELTHALSFMIDHPEERKKYGAALRETAINKFSIEKMLTKLKEEYQE